MGPKIVETDRRCGERFADCERGVERGSVRVVELGTKPRERGVCVGEGREVFGWGDGGEVEFIAVSLPQDKLGLFA